MKTYTEELPDTALAWTAGIIDGEGYVGLRKHRKAYQPVVSVGQVDIRMLQKLQEFWGGNISPKRNSHGWKMAWLWDITGTRALTMLSLVRPFLVIKGEQADVVDEYKPYSHQDREDMRERLKILRGTT